jgi:uncharacterized membrane protein YhaH (DUF805 family)
MIRIALMNRHYRDFFAEITGRAVYSLIALRLRRKRDANASHRILLTVFPTYVLSLILVYFIGAMIAFSFCIGEVMPSIHGAGPSSLPGRP